VTVSPPPTALSARTPALSATGVTQAVANIPGFRIGTEDGARLGTSDGGTLALPSGYSFAATIAPSTTSISAATPPLTATGAGTVSAATPATTLIATTPDPGPTGTGQIAIATGVNLLAATTPGVGVAVSGAAPIAVTPTALSVSTLPLSVGYMQWVIAGQPVGEVTEETKTVDTLSLVTRAPTETVETDLRPLKSDEGQVAILATDDGGFVAVDRAAGTNTFSVTAPIRRQPLRQDGDYHVDRYEESLVSPDVREWDVELDLIEAANRTDSPAISETPASDEWGLETRFGEIATGRVDAEFTGTGKGGVERFELTAVLTFDQAHVFEAAVSRLNAARIREIPDATNLAVDDTSADANTITVDAPDGQSVVSDGDYVVSEWASTRLSEAYQSVEMTIAKK